MAPSRLHAALLACGACFVSLPAAWARLATYQNFCSWPWLEVAPTSGGGSSQGVIKEWNTLLLTQAHASGQANGLWFPHAFLANASWETEFSVSASVPVDGGGCPRLPRGSRVPISAAAVRGCGEWPATSWRLLVSSPC
jgi:hypothetical protein